MGMYKREPKSRLGAGGNHRNFPRGRDIQVETKRVKRKQETDHGNQETESVSKIRLGHSSGAENKV